MEPRIRFCTTSDGVRIAFATAGEGPPLVFVPNWVSPLKYREYEPSGFFQELAAKRQFIQFDRRGTGMSDRGVPDFSRGVLVKDLEAVIDHLNLRRVALLAVDMGGPVALEYAFRHPDKVSHLILYGCYVRGQALGTHETRQALVRLTRGGWNFVSEIWPTMVMPGADPESARRFFTALRESCSADAAASQLEAAGGEDVTNLLPEIKTPTLVLHPRRDRAVPFELGRELASLMPNARLAALDYGVHWDPRNTTPILQAIDEFLGEGEEAGAGAEQPEPGAFRTILFTDMEGSTILTQRLGDAQAQEVLHTHNAIIRDALKAHGGSEIKHTGDGIMASFSSATRALECAIAMQQAFAQHNQSAEEPIRVRIGLNAGEPVAEEEDLFGTAVQLAARICGQTEPDQILASNVVRELAAGKGFLFSDRGDVALRGFEDPVRLFEVRWREA